MTQGKFTFVGDYNLYSLVLGMIAVGVTDYVETGCRRGDTCNAVAFESIIPVWGCDTNGRAVKIALKQASRQLRLDVARSEAWLPKIVPDLGLLPLFYLDAHGGKVPVREELKIIDGLCGTCVIIIHDFIVPGRPKFTGKPAGGVVCDFNYVARAFGVLANYRFFYPDYDIPQGQHWAGHLLAFRKVEPFGLESGLWVERSDCLNEKR